MKYLAIKIQDFPYWVWFKTENVEESMTTFKGKGGRGKGGELTEVEIPTRMVEGRIQSNSLQYK